MAVLNSGQSEDVEVSRLKCHPRNPRRGDLEVIQESVEVNGFWGAVVAQRSTGYVLAGNHRLIAAKQLGYETLPVIWVDVDDEKARTILAADNRTSDKGGYDDAVLASLLAQVQEDTGLEGTGYTDADLSELLEACFVEEHDLEESNVSDLQYEHSKEVKAKWGVAEGQIWQVGRHKLLCGSSLNEAHLSALTCGYKVELVYADPPYGIKIVDSGGFVGGGEAYNIPFGGKKASAGTVGGGLKAKVNKYTPIAGDDSVDVAIGAYRLLSTRHPSPGCTHIWWGGNYYADALPPSSCWIVWDKENNTTSFADAELAWCSSPTAVRLFRHMWNGMIKASERGQRRVHPTQKPIALAQWCYEKYAPEGCVVLDPFLGSGPSVVAAEQTGRTCLGAELSPEYVALNLERLSEMGLKPELVEEL